MLESVRHHKRHPDVDMARGRPRRWRREDVLFVAEKLDKTLLRKTGGRVSSSSFISLYLPVLHYPADVSDRLDAGDINIREAAYLARLTPERLKCAPREARQARAEILQSHILTKGSQESLRRRIKTALGEQPAMDSGTLSGRSGKSRSDELLDKNPYDARHLFYEEIQQLVEAMRETQPEELNGKTLTEFLRQLDKLLAMLRRAKQGRRAPL